MVSEPLKVPELYHCLLEEIGLGRWKAWAGRGGSLAGKYLTEVLSVVLDFNGTEIDI